MYKIYPSILDSFNYYLRAPDGDESELIKKINRIKTEPTEAMLTGVKLEKLINSRRPYDVDDVGLLFGQEVDEKVYNELLERCSGLKQQFLKSTFTVDGVDVLLYGFADYIYQDSIKDLKYTGRYEFPKYNKGSQHIIYPLIAEKMGIKSSSFQYVITDLKRVYIEEYVINQSMIDSLFSSITNFIGFLEDKRHIITDKKIFGED